MLLALALAATAVLAHTGHDGSDGPDDGNVTMRYSGDGADRTWSLHTLADHQQVRVQLTASTGKSRIEVRIVDPDGHDVAHLEGSGELDVDSGALRLVDHPAGPGEGRRGTWVVRVVTSFGDGSYTLRWWGLAPPEKPGGDARH